jgi:Carbon starvation protein, predicted membrane protein
MTEGGTMKNVIRVFSVVLLIMVGTVFAVGPAGLIQLLFSNGGSTGILTNKLFWLVLILVYYFIATFLSIDKIIGKIYPVFGICLIIMAVGSGRGYLHQGLCDPRDLEQLHQYASSGHSHLELHVHHRGLRRYFRLPCHPRAP